ncbi:lytic transglycosylase domain-containing protein [Nocardioides sp. AX2bis]|uniref:lytic transglycosylase domain-containing protein n=1 Tax=Nocardioides sp. AX2bis TaxID=2653157 RepID=UPI0012F38BF2|nr:lytic murein transglycosylase [Nocardioides sp. AX2bis]VXC00615.1 conserved exported hypothetical protein [Nocardioides sp. AX2bis]
MKRSPGGSTSSNRSSRHVTLRLRRLAVAAVGGAVVVVTATSQVGAAPVAVVPAAAPAAETAETASTDYWAAPTELPQPATLAAAEPAVERAARAAARGGSSRTVAAIGAPDEAALTDIPAPALSAYQRAAAVIDEAMPSCALDWELLAAIGRVESDHGRFGGSVLSARGVAKPSIIGVPLTGGEGTRRISDSDAGELDGDKVLDRAVGPMQFIPSTWSVVGVDADGDGERNPQDIDDAALAAAVYLCGDGDDLSTVGGREAAVLTYNNSSSYVATVLALRSAYAQGDPATTVPTVSTVDLGTGSAATAPEGAAPLTGQAQDAADQQMVAEERDAADKVSKATGPRGAGQDRDDQGRDRGDRPAKGGTVRADQDRDQDLDSSGENVPRGNGGGAQPEAPVDPETPVDPENPVEPTDPVQTPDPTASPAPAAPSPTAPAPAPEPELVLPSSPDLVELTLASGTVVTVADLVADPTLVPEDQVAAAFEAAGYDPVVGLAELAELAAL